MLIFEDITKSLYVLDKVEETKRSKYEIDMSLIDSFLSSIEECLV
jgi:hypothetical protein